MPITHVDIANEALDLVGASTIVSLNDPTPEARIVARALRPTVSRILQSYPFRCARRFVVLDLPELQLEQMAVRFQLPNDCLGVLHADTERWQIARDSTGQWLVVFNEATKALAVEYIADVFEPNQLDPVVRELVVYELAIKIAAKLTESPQRISALTRKAIFVRKQAQASDARYSGSSAYFDGSRSTLWIDELGG